jgi:cation diffusion facilitator family transporter
MQTTTATPSENLVHPPRGPGYETPQAALARERRELRAAVLSLLIGVALLVVKFIAYLLTDSAAIFSDALESIVNVVASGTALYAIWLAHRPADVKHPYGHGKVEFVSAGLEGAMMMVAALVIVLRAAEQLIRGAHINESTIAWGILLLVVAMLINGALGLFLIRSGKTGGSITLEADGRHLLSDAVTSAAVLIALALVKLTGFRRLDAITAIAVAIYVAVQSSGLLRRSWAGLMDEQDVEDDRLLREILDAHVGPAGKEPRICSYHKLRHRHSGRYHWVDFHIMVPASWDVQRGHEVASAIEYEIETALGEGNATAHVEPCGGERCETCAGAVETET